MAKAKQTIVTTTKIRTTTFPMNIKLLLGRAAKTRFDLAIQRNNVWDLDRMSLLMHSVMYGYPMPPVFARKLEPLEGEDAKVAADTDWMLDGKQRLSTILGYCQDGDVLKDEETGKPIPVMDEKNDPKKDDKGKPIYKLYEGFKLQNVPTVTVWDEVESKEIVVDVNGKRFTELPDFLQEIILSAKVDMVRLENMTDEEQDEMFVRLNNGMPLKNMELTRALAGTTNMDFIEKVSKLHFFLNVVDLPAASRNRFGDDELVTQILQLVSYIGTADSVPGFSGKELKAFAIKLKAEGGISQEMQTAIEQTTAYLGDALPFKQKDFKKVHIPTIFVMANRAMQEGISPRKYGGYVQQFFAERYKNGTEYGAAASRGSAKKENVNKRLVAMMLDYDRNIAEAPNYEIPEKVMAVLSDEQKKGFEVAQKALISEEKKQTEFLKKKAKAEAEQAALEAAATKDKGDTTPPSEEPKAPGEAGDAPKIEGATGDAPKVDDETPKLDADKDKELVTTQG